jgi:thiol-disulfide isomerase/thioredoxin
MSSAEEISLADGIVAVVKESCPTCRLVAPVLLQLVAIGVPMTVYSQDDSSFPPGVHTVDDTDLEFSYRLEIEAVPTLLRIVGGQVVDRLSGWSRPRWEALTGVTELGPGLPEYRPGCGSRSVEPGIAEELAARYDGNRLKSRRVELAALEDEVEACFERGWTDGLPVVPPTGERVLRVLAGSSRPPDDIVRRA